MKRRNLGRTDIRVPDMCLGTMTWGTQTSEQDAHRQIDMALDRGIDFLDTAEMYPTTPLSAETQGRTEAFIGSWIEKTGRRNDLTIATKIVGDGYEAIRGGAPIRADTMRVAVDESLARLKTGVIDLYQLHWPNRGSYHFRKWWRFDPTTQDTAETLDHVEEVLHCAELLIEQGKIRALGLSNDSCWGTMRFLALAESEGLPRVATVQNEYSLLCRHYDLDMAEMSHHEDVGLLAFSPLAAGILTGKYLDGAVPENSRQSINDGLGGRLTPRCEPATRAYLAIAEKHGIDPVHFALAFARSRPFMASVIFGATTCEQLEHAMGAGDVTLPDEAQAEIAETWRAHPVPM